MENFQYKIALLINNYKRSFENLSFKVECTYKWEARKPIFSTWLKVGRGKSRDYWIYMYIPGSVWETNKKKKLFRQYLLWKASWVKSFLSKLSSSTRNVFISRCTKYCSVIGPWPTHGSVKPSFSNTSICSQKLAAERRKQLTWITWRVYN